jgi:hypothetical protein
MFHLVAAENADYGFRRNAYGVRWIGAAAALVEGDGRGC